MSRRRRQDEGDDERLFERAMEGVDRLEDARPKVLRRRKSPRTPHRGACSEPPRFEIERWGEQLEGRAPGMDRRQLSRLRRGQLSVDLRLDLHGLDASGARGVVREGLAQAIREGLRCVLIIHGRGLRSPDAPVLKEALPAWLAEPPHGSSVLAFTTARPEEGGPGATRVLLRSRR